MLTFIGILLLLLRLLMSHCLRYNAPCYGYHYTLSCCLLFTISSTLFFTGHCTGLRFTHSFTNTTTVKCPRFAAAPMRLTITRSNTFLGNICTYFHSTCLHVWCPLVRYMHWRRLRLSLSEVHWRVSTTPGWTSTFRTCSTSTHMTTTTVSLE